MRNLQLKDGLCNGTRLIIIAMHDNVLKCKVRVIHIFLPLHIKHNTHYLPILASLSLQVITGSAAGKIIFLPRIKLCQPEGLLSVNFSRQQFPIRLAFSMTINKAQVHFLLQYIPFYFSHYTILHITTIFRGKHWIWLEFLCESPSSLMVNSTSLAQGFAMHDVSELKHSPTTIKLQTLFLRKSLNELVFYILFYVILLNTVF